MVKITSFIRKLILGLFVGFTGFLTIALIFAVSLVIYELHHSRFQSRWLAKQTDRFSYSLQPGASSQIYFPDTGAPEDDRRGYAYYHNFKNSLDSQGYLLTNQMRWSPALLSHVKKGFYLPYREKESAGLELLDRHQVPLFKVEFPSQGYVRYSDIPPVVVKTLLFIEDRDLLDTSRPYLNPAVNWERFGFAIIEQFKRQIGLPHKNAGGSTLATQLEKYRHSPGGRTQEPRDKLRQMVSASYRAYLDGPNSIEARKQIVRRYINTVPLAALPGYGEVNGLGDGLVAWYGVNFDSINTVLRTLEQPAPTLIGLEAQAKAFRQILQLFIAHRRPSDLLHADASTLDEMANAHIRLFKQEKFLSDTLLNTALRVRVPLRRKALRPDRIDFRERKTANAIRSRLLRLLGLPRIYDLDRLDLVVQTTLDDDAEKSVIRKLRLLNDTAYVARSGLKGFRLLEKGDPSKVLYSFTLYESKEGVNELRVQADNLDQPLNLNEQMKLDLGSTAKLRTLVHYLEVITDLHKQHKGLSPSDLKKRLNQASDPLRRWTLSLLLEKPSLSLEATLEAAMGRSYSASPAGSFFTGGGIHTFNNFDPADNSRVLDLWESLKRSVNLPFVRLMRDLTQYHSNTDILDNMRESDSLGQAIRHQYLVKFAQQEGSVFLARYWKKYRKNSSREALDLFFQSYAHSPRRAAAAYKALFPDSTGAQFASYYTSLFPLDSATAPLGIDVLVDRLESEKWNLSDFGYAARVHPLELWYMMYIQKGGDRSWKAVRKASTQQLNETYDWLFRTRYRSAQDIRIRTLLEIEAFEQIHKAWSRLGYPFPTLVPSLATALGSSADRPSALAELMGILHNKGIKQETRIVRKLHFGADTPYETKFSAQRLPPDTVLNPVICKVIKKALLQVVESGSAVRGRNAFPDGKGGFLALGGKTGTGDGRFETYGRGGSLLESKVVSRSATFVFFLGDRFFGTLTAFVQGSEAGNFGFTSSLPVAILKQLEPDLRVLLRAPSSIEENSGRQ